jgi:hypothetical protein
MSTQAESGTLRNPDSRTSAPRISLPKGGGAIRGIGEKFAANPVTGTGALTVPLTVSPGRSGFGPHLSLSYDSGAGNGPFGFGWSLSLPSITRKTDKGLPEYRDAESDVYVLSGAEDLVLQLGYRRLRSNRDLSAARPARNCTNRSFRCGSGGLFQSPIERKHAKCDCSTSAGAARRRQPLPRRHHGHRVRDPPVPPAHRGAVQPHRALD